MDKRTDDDTLKRLLGPAEPELLCDECFEKLDAYVELELQGTQADDRIPGMRAHLEGCPACREDYDSLRELVQSKPNS
jgi:predicted anti-sigma-YlaC factor YlaD